MSDFQVLQEALRQASRRRRLARAWRGLWWGLFMGSTIWVVLIAAYKLVPLPYGWVAWGAYGTAGSAVLGFVIGLARRISLEETARWLDLRQGLRERLSTALEWRGREKVSGSWGDLVLRDAAEQVKRLHFRRLVPLRLPRLASWLLLVLALGVGLGFVPKYRSEAYRERQRQERFTKEAGSQMAEVVRRELETRPPVRESTRETMKGVEELGKTLEKGKLKRADALKELSKATEELKQEAEKLADDPAMQRMQRAAREEGGAPTGQAGLQEKIDALEKKLGQKQVDPEALAGLREKLAALKQKAAAMQSGNAENSAAARAQMAHSLAQLKQQLEGMGQSLPSLQAAIKALKAAQVDRVLTEMDQSLEELKDLEEMAKALQQMQAQTRQPGKNLAEQLSRGQVGAAQKTLNEMIKKLSRGDLGAEARQALQKEINQALDPAGYYAKAKEHMKQALQQMQQGQNSQAAQSLASAAKELEKMRRQFGGMQSLAKAMQALQQAKMCVGNGMSWGQCQGMGKKFGMGPGSNPGGGVGTWASESSQRIENPPLTPNGDFSDANRPAMEPRGITEREAKIDRNLQPTRIKGQFSQGGPMPSVRLKGMHIKGESNAEYKKVLSGAQSEARSALSEQKVPRAHQDRVRNYFDDLE